MDEVLDVKAGPVQSRVVFVECERISRDKRPFETLVPGLSLYRLLFCDHFVGKYSPEAKMVNPCPGYDEIHNYRALMWPVTLLAQFKKADYEFCCIQNFTRY